MISPAPSGRVYTGDMIIPFTQVDAFTARPHAGNPAAVMPLDAWLPDDVLQAIAAENNLSETAFTVPADGEADYELRWFTPTTEIAMCGHATLAAGHVLMTGDRIRFETRKAGVLTVARTSASGALALDLPAIPVARAQHAGLLAALGLAAAPAFLSTHEGQDTAIILLPDEAAVRVCAPDMKALAAINLMAIVTAPGDAADIVSRVFVPAWGVDEDPVTGSAHAALAPFWCDRLGRDSITAFQASARGGDLGCRVAGDRVVLSGACVTVIRGEYLL